MDGRITGTTQRRPARKTGGDTFVNSLATVCPRWLASAVMRSPALLVSALFCAATMALAPVFLSWCVEAHPDTWQMFFASLSVFLCVLSYPARDTSRSGEQLKVRPLLGAAAAAGAAFSTKYIGVLLLPLLFATALAAPIPAISEEEAERTKRQLSTAATILIVPSLFFGMLLNPSRTLRLFPSWHALPPDTLASFVLLTRGGCFLLAVFSLVMVIACRTGLGVTKYAGIAQRILLLLAILAAFFLTFGLTSPWAAWRLAFVPSVYTMGAYVNFGHGVKADVYGLRWLTTLAEPKVIGPAAAALALAGLAAVTWQWKCAHFRLWQAPLAILAAWAVFFAAFLILRVNLAKDYYLFPMIPATIVLAGAGIAKLREWLAPAARCRTRRGAEHATTRQVGYYLGTKAQASPDRFNGLRQGRRQGPILPQCKGCGERWVAVRPQSAGPSNPSYLVSLKSRTCQARGRTPGRTGWSSFILPWPACRPTRCPLRKPPYGPVRSIPRCC